jgi:hypothetical protein
LNEKISGKAAVWMQEKVRRRRWLMRGNREEKSRNKSEKIFIFYIFYKLFYRKIKKEVLLHSKNNSPNSEKKISQFKRKSQRKLSANLS